jgi:uncharacterized protein (DUF2141 family)
MMKRFQVGLLILPLAGLLFSATAKADFSRNGNLNVEIDGLRNQKGQVCVSLFNNSRGFPDKSDRVLQKSCVKVTEIPLVIKFENLKLGSYAAVVMHDEDNDGTVNQDDLGIPSEGFGFSQNPEIVTSAPKFGDAAFFVAGAATDIKIKLVYMSGS